jgi:hypothetical protein
VDLLVSVDYSGFVVELSDDRKDWTITELKDQTNCENVLWVPKGLKLDEITKGLKS